LLPAVRTTYRRSVDRDLVVLVILSAVWAMAQFIIVMVAAVALVLLRNPPSRKVCWLYRGGR
jgi:hypothetical protein